MNIETMKNYVVGFMFSEDREHVALIRKERPVWQKGLLNGIGGKVEEGESSEAAMEREFKEETGYQADWSQWVAFATLYDKEPRSFSVECFATVGQVDELETMEDEEIVLFPVIDIHNNRSEFVFNVSWLIPAALEALETTKQASYINCIYLPEPHT